MVLGVEDFVIGSGDGAPARHTAGVDESSLDGRASPGPRVWAGRGKAWSARGGTWGFHGVWVSPLLSLEELGIILGGKFWQLGQLCLPVCGEAFYYFSSWYHLWGLTCTLTAGPQGHKMRP